jgi:DNA polymerase-1
LNEARSERLKRWVAGAGPEKADLVVVGEAPGDTEVVTGKPFQGRSGELLNATLAANGIQRADVFATNAIMCHHKPNSDEMASCRPRLIEEIKSREPKIVLALGKVAFNQLCQTRTALSDVIGTLRWVPDLQCWVIPTWHPAFVLRGDGAAFPDIVNAIWRCERFISGKEVLPDPNAKERDYPWTFFRNPKKMLTAIRWFERQAEKRGQITLGCDTESKSPGRWPHPESDEWIMWQLYDGNRGAVFDMRAAMQDEEFKDAARRMLTNPRIIWSMHNGAVYDCRVFRFNLQVCPRDANIRDTLVLGIGLSERANAVGLEPLSRQYLNAPAYKSKLKSIGYKHAKGPQNADQWRALAEYGIDDAYNGYHLNRVLPPMVRDEGTMKLCRNVLMPLALTCGRISGRGMIADRSQFAKLNDEWGSKCDELVNKLQDLADEAGWPLDPAIAKAKDGRLNPRSHLQLAHLAYDVLGLTATQGLTNRKFRASKWSGKERQRSVDGDFLLGHIDTPFAQLMRSLRAYDKLVRTYVKGLERELEYDGLIHPDFNIAKTATGRLVVRPLLQVLPHYGAHRELSDTDFAAETRRLFPARKGYVLVAADYKQLEFRVAWALTGDEELGKALMSGDMHANTARYMFQREEVDDADRHAAKRVGFGVAYNRSAFTLSRGPLFDVLGGDSLSDSKRQNLAQGFIDSFWELYHVYRSVQLGWVNDAMTKGELETPFGRKRRWMLITPENRKEIENQACNFPIQSTASDMCSTALVKLEPALAKAKVGYPQYTVHDQVICEIKESKLQQGLQIISDVMRTAPFKTSAQFDVTFEVGPTLGDLEKVKFP